MEVPSYNFKVTPELIWAVAVTVVSVLATAIATQGAVAPTDWRAWAIALAAGVVRAVVGLLLDKTGQPAVDTPEVKPDEPAA